MQYQYASKHQPTAWLKARFFRPCIQYIKVKKICIKNIKISRGGRGDTPQPHLPPPKAGAFPILLAWLRLWHHVITPCRCIITVTVNISETFMWLYVIPVNTEYQKNYNVVSLTCMAKCFTQYTIILITALCDA